MQVEIKMSPEDFIVGFVEAIKNPEVANLLKGLFSEAQSSANTAIGPKHDPSEMLKILDFIGRYGDTYGGEQTLRNRCNLRKGEPGYLKHERSHPRGGHFLICLNDVKASLKT